MTTPKFENLVLFSCWGTDMCVELLLRYCCMDLSLSRHPNSRHPKQSFSPSKNSLCNQMTFSLMVGIDFQSNASFVTLGKIDSLWSQFCHLVNGLDFGYWSLGHIPLPLWVHLRSCPSIKRRGLWLSPGHLILPSTRNTPLWCCSYVEVPRTISIMK